MEQINFFAIFGAAVVSMVVGFAWYSKTFFGKPWMAAMHLSESDLMRMKNEKEKMSVTYGMSFLSAIVTAFVMTKLFYMLGVTSIGGALELVLWFWLGFVATTQFTAHLFDHKSNTQIFIINTFHQLASLAAMATALIYWL